MKEYTLHPNQYNAICSDKRFVLCISGIQGGKTYLGTIWLLNEIANHWNDDFMIAAPTYKILQQSTLKKFFELVPDDWGEYKKQENVFKLKHGGDVFIRSTEDPDSIEGMKLRSAWLDEAGQMKSAVWINAQGRLAVQQGRCILTTTFYALNWVYRELYNKKTEDHEVFKWRSKDNPYFPQEEWDRARKDLPPDVFARRYEGEPRKLSGLVYPDFDEDCVFDDLSIIPDKVDTACGIDFGYENPFVCLWVARDKKGTHYIFAEHYKSKTLLKDHSNIIKGVNRYKKISGYYCDPSAKQQIEELKSLGFGPIKPTNNDVEIGIERVTKLIRNKQLKVYNKCLNTIDEFETYHRPEPRDEKEVKEKPIKAGDHTMDALRYVVGSTTGYRFYKDKLIEPRYDLPDYDSDSTFTGY